MRRTVQEEECGAGFQRERGEGRSEQREALGWALKHEPMCGAKRGQEGEQTCRGCGSKNGFHGVKRPEEGFPFSCPSVALPGIVLQSQGHNQLVRSSWSPL